MYKVLCFFCVHRLFGLEVYEPIQYTEKNETVCKKYIKENYSYGNGKKVGKVDAEIEHVQKSQIQIGTIESNEKMVLREDNTLDYAKINEMLNTLSGFKASYSTEFGADAEELAQTVEETKEAVQKRDDNKIKILLHKIGGFAEKVATGVLSAWIKDQIKGIM